MGTLKLHHIKHRTHLKDSIEYILNKMKTDEGKYIFGDSGYTAEMVYDTFLYTKNLYEKHEGRQAYHYILTFAEEDDVSPQLAQEITEKFMKRLFPDDGYDWAGAIHTDTNHLHSHIIFNSVNRNTGYKYRYEKGDWEKTIQKIVDDICNENGLHTIAYEYDQDGKSSLKEKEEKKTTNYDKHNGEMKNKGDLIRKDIDRCIAEAKDFDDFLRLMKNDGYYIRQGNSKKHGAYITFKPHGVKQGFRSYTLGENYNPKKISERIEFSDIRSFDEIELSERQQRRILALHNIPTLTYRRYYAKYIYIARTWQNGKPFNNSYIYKMAVIENQKMSDEYRLLKKASIKSEEDAAAYYERIVEELKNAYQFKKRFPAGSIEREEVERTIRELQFNKRVAGRIMDRLDKIDVSGDERRQQRAVTFDEGR